MDNYTFNKIIQNIPPYVIGGASGALLAPLLVDRLIGDYLLLKAFSVPLGWTIGSKLAPEVIDTQPINNLNYTI